MPLHKNPIQLTIAMPQSPHPLYISTLALTTLFGTMWFLTPYAATSIAQQYDSVHQWNANATFVRLRASKQLMMSLHHGNIENTELHHRHHNGRHNPPKQWVFLPISYDATVVWLRRLRLVLMV